MRSSFFFERELDRLALHDLSGYGPSESGFHKQLDCARWQVDGFKLNPQPTNS